MGRPPAPPPAPPPAARRRRPPAPAPAPALWPLALAALALAPLHAHAHTHVVNAENDTAWAAVGRESLAPAESSSPSASAPPPPGAAPTAPTAAADTPLPPPTTRAASEAPATASALPSPTPTPAPTPAPSPAPSGPPPTATAAAAETSIAGAWSVAPAASTPATVRTTPAAAPTSPAPPAPLPSRRPFRPPPAPHLRQSARYGPYFEDGEGPANVTARVGSRARLDCRVGLLHDKTVTWMHRKADSMHLLTVGKVEYSSDQRIRLRFRYPSNWRLEIEYVTRRDEGLYECQVATHPPRVRQVHLRVTAPEVSVVDESGHEVSERYYKAGSAVELTCIASQLEDTGDPLVWRHGDSVLDRGVSVNASAAAGAVLSTLTVAHAVRAHSGNYTCAVGSLAAVTVAVHVLNGELPAAVQHGSGARSGGRPGAALRWLCALAALALRLAARPPAPAPAHAHARPPGPR